MYKRMHDKSYANFTKNLTLTRGAIVQELPDEEEIDATI
jgi:hypothetical protein